MHKLKVFESDVLREIIECKKEKVTGEWRQLRDGEFRDLYLSPKKREGRAWTG